MPLYCGHKVSGSGKRPRLLISVGTPGGAGEWEAKEGSRGPCAGGRGPKVFGLSPITKHAMTALRYTRGEGPWEMGGHNGAVRQQRATAPRGCCFVSVLLFHRRRWDVLAVKRWGSAVVRRQRVVNRRRVAGNGSQFVSAGGVGVPKVSSGNGGERGLLGHRAGGGGGFAASLNRTGRGCASSSPNAFALAVPLRAGRLHLPCHRRTALASAGRLHAIVRGRFGAANWRLRPRRRDRGTTVCAARYTCSTSDGCGALPARCSEAPSESLSQPPGKLGFQPQKS